MVGVRSGHEARLGRDAPLGTDAESSADATTASNFRARAVSSHLQVAPGSEFHVALELQIADGWVYYSPDPGPAALAGELDVVADPRQPGPALWASDTRKATASLGFPGLIVGFRADFGMGG